jgi:hypothetical protein
MRTAPNIAAIAERPEDRALVAVLAKRRIRELDRLRDLGFKQIERLNAAADSMPRAVVFDRMLGAKGQVMEFERLARAIRQVIVLEFEIRGLFEAPNRDARRLRLVKSDREGFEPPDREDLFADLREFRDFERELQGPRPDYRAGPLDEVVAGIRKVLGAEPPQDDPFAPPPKPRTAEAPLAAPPAAKLPPATVKLPEKPTASPKPHLAQEAVALRAAVRAIKATGGHGFRIPTKKAKAKKAAAKKARAQLRQGRAPPG